MSVEMVDVHKKNHTQNVTHLTMRIKKKKNHVLNLIKRDKETKDTKGDIQNSYVEKN